jgi:hypothetical protein
MLSNPGSTGHPLAGPRRGARLMLLALLLFPSARLAAGPAEAPPPIPLPQDWAGRVVFPAGMNPGLTADRITLRVWKLSDDDEVAGLLQALRLHGQAGLRDAMRLLPAKGFVNIGKLAGTEVRVIRVLDLEDGRRRLRIYSDFPIHMYDKSEPRGSLEHPFGFLELTIDASGKNGTGLVIARAALSLEKEGLGISNAETPPLQVVDVLSDSPPAPAAPPSRP